MPARVAAVRPLWAIEGGRITIEGSEFPIDQPQLPTVRVGDLPARVAGSHLVISRSGASTVAELAAIGRPAILVPLPHALDQDQAANARVLERAGGAISLRQSDFTPERLAGEITALATAPQKLVAMAAAARSQGSTDAAERLADLVMQVAGIAKT